MVQMVSRALRFSTLPPVTRHWYCSASPSASLASTRKVVLLGPLSCALPVLPPPHDVRLHAASAADTTAIPRLAPRTCRPSIGLPLTRNRSTRPPGSGDRERVSTAGRASRSYRSHSAGFNLGRCCADGATPRASPQQNSLQYRGDLRLRRETLIGT